LVGARQLQALVRPQRTRLAAGRDAERGRPAALNGNGDVGVELGYSIRAASMLSGVARSAIADRVRRAREIPP
jgi:hypothetical protein